MQKFITTHHVNPANEELTIEASDNPGAGGAQHRYVISGFDSRDNISKFPTDEPTSEVVILFQNGPIPINGVNGVTHEALLAIVKDRLEAFQAGPYACDDNAVALASIDNAITALHTRTKARLARGVEGTHAV